jgi:hypothetical protein
MTDDDWCQDLAVNLNGPFIIAAVAIHGAPYRIDNGKGARLTSRPRLKLGRSPGRRRLRVRRARAAATIAP